MLTIGHFISKFIRKKNTIATWDYTEKKTKVLWILLKKSKFMVRNVTNLEEERLINPELTDLNEERFENSLRPKTLNEYIGQDKVKENMKVYIEAAKKRGEALDHVLLYGPPGTGKTYNTVIKAIEITNPELIQKDKDGNVENYEITKPRRFSSIAY